MVIVNCYSLSDSWKKHRHFSGLSSSHVDQGLFGCGSSTDTQHNALGVLLEGSRRGDISRIYMLGKALYYKQSRIWAWYLIWTHDQIGLKLRVTNAPSILGIKDGPQNLQTRCVFLWVGHKTRPWLVSLPGLPFSADPYLFRHLFCHGNLSTRPNGWAAIDQEHLQKSSTPSPARRHPRESRWYGRRFASLGYG